MEKLMKELTDVLRYFGYPQENIEQFERILYATIEEHADEVQAYLDTL